MCLWYLTPTFSTSSKSNIPLPTLGPFRDIYVLYFGHQHPYYKLQSFSPNSTYIRISYNAMTQTRTHRGRICQLQLNVKQTLCLQAGYKDRVWLKPYIFHKFPMTIPEQKVLSSPKREKWHMQNVNTHTLCAKQPKRERKRVRKITENTPLDLLYTPP